MYVILTHLGLVSFHCFHSEDNLSSSPRCSRSVSVVTLARPPTLIITDHLFRYSSLRLWNQLPD